MNSLYSTLLLLLILVFLFRLFSKKPKHLHSHWNTLIDDLQYSTKEFYALLKTELQSHNIQNISFTEKSLNENTVLSSKRLYLRVQWKGYMYDCCCAPFGNGTFVSWWLLREQKPIEIFLSNIPFIGGWLVQQFFPITYYTMDTTSMFMSYCQQSVLNVIDSMTKEKGLRTLTEPERKPILKDIFKR